MAEYIEGGISRWHEMASGKTSDQLLDLVISELTGMSLSTATEFLSCQVPLSIFLKTLWEYISNVSLNQLLSIQEACIITHLYRISSLIGCKRKFPFLL